MQPLLWLLAIVWKCRSAYQIKCPSVSNCCSATVCHKCLFSPAHGGSVSRLVTVQRVGNGNTVAHHVWLYSAHLCIESGTQGLVQQVAGSYCSRCSCAFACFLALLNLALHVTPLTQHAWGQVRRSSGVVHSGSPVHTGLLWTEWPLDAGFNRLSHRVGHAYLTCSV